MAEVVIIAYGRVQGVNFRWMTKRFADSLGLKGTVENRSGGSVKIIAQGTKELLEKLIEWVKRGPGFSKVSETEIQWREPSEDYVGFEISRKESYIIDKVKGVVNLGRSIIQND